jgi:hypothetical protein
MEAKMTVFIAAQTSVERPGRLQLAIKEWQRQLVERQNVTQAATTSK